MKMVAKQLHNSPIVPRPSGSAVQPTVSTVEFIAERDAEEEEIEGSKIVVINSMSQRRRTDPGQVGDDNDNVGGGSGGAHLDQAEAQPDQEVAEPLSADTKAHADMQPRLM
jgi:hypothetical protein